MNEHEIQNDIRAALNFCPGEFWRVNVGSGWIGKTIYHDKHQARIINPRWFSSGVPKGFPDIIGIVPRKIREDDVGKTLGQFVFFEVKSKSGRASDDQKTFHDLLIQNGALGGIVRSIDDAINILKEIKP